MNDEIQTIIKNAIFNLIDNTTSKEKFDLISKKHINKIHFIPIKYRILGGLLQSLNIQFGNYIEVLFKLLTENEKHLKLYDDISGFKNILLKYSNETDNVIDNYITACQNPENKDNLLDRFEDLINTIIINEKNNQASTMIESKHDIDLIFKDLRTDIIYYIEIKYNDDHDTGKFIDINRKFIKTYAGIINKFGIYDKTKLKPILYYFNNKIMKGNIYLPESYYILRGNGLFKSLFTITYEEIDYELKRISNDDEILKLFDDLYNKIRYDI